MYLENIVFDAVDPQRLGRFWETALATERLTDEPDIFETRLRVDGGPTLDLCFQRVPDAPAEPQRLHVDLRGGVRQDEAVGRLLDLGARHVDVGQGDVPWVVLADVEGNPCCVLADRPVYADTGPVAALPLSSADPGRDVVFWSWLTGWRELPADTSVRSLVHPSARGPILELCPETSGKTSAKNRMHLDVRLEAGDDAEHVAAAVASRGGRELHPLWARGLPWRLYADPSGNEFCVLPARS